MVYFLAMALNLFFNKGKFSDQERMRLTATMTQIIYFLLKYQDILWAGSPISIVDTYI